MTAPLRDQFMSKIGGLQEGNFQDLVEKVFQEKYGSDFDKIKDKKDRGCDGIINQQKIVAIYGPEKPSLDKFKRKVDSDYTKYEKHWQDEYPKWLLVYNDNFTSSRIQFLDNLGNNIDRMGLKNIISEIRKLSYSKQQRIAEYLGIPERFFEWDVLKTVVDDMLEQESIEPEELDRSMPDEIEKKFKQNIDSNDINAWKQEYAEKIHLKNVLEDVLETYDNKQIRHLKSNIKGQFTHYDGNFESKMNKLMDHYSQKRRGKDDRYEAGVRTVILHLFEQCHLGERV